VCLELRRVPADTALQTVMLQATMLQCCIVTNGDAPSNNVAMLQTVILKALMLHCYTW